MTTFGKYVVGIILVILGLAGYFIFRPEPAVRIKEKMRIGLVLPLTGNEKTTGLGVKEVATMVSNELNYDGQEVEMFYEDSKCDSKQAANSAEKLVKVDRVHILIGGVCNSDSAAIASVAGSNSVPMIIISERGMLEAPIDYVFRILPSREIILQQLAKSITKRQKKIALISETPIENQSYFENNLKNEGAEIVINETFRTNAEARLLVSKLKNSGAEAVYFEPNSSEAATNLLKAYKDFKIKLPVYGNERMISINDATLIPENMEVADIINLPTDNKILADFLGKLSLKVANFDRVNTYVAAYDSIKLSRSLFEASGGGEKLRDALFTTNNYQGLLGNYGFDQDGEVKGLKSTLKQFRAGKWVEVQE